MPDNALLQVLLIGVSGLFGAGLMYFVFIGVRAIFRQSQRIASSAGHLRGAAVWRAVLRMAVWAAFFGVFYLFLYFLGLRIGWWALIPAAIGLAGIIWGLLQADRLLTVRRRRRAPAGWHRSYAYRADGRVRLHHLVRRGARRLIPQGEI